MNPEIWLMIYTAVVNTIPVIILIASKIKRKPKEKDSPISDGD